MPVKPTELSLDEVLILSEMFREEMNLWIAR